MEQEYSIKTGKSLNKSTHNCIYRQLFTKEKGVSCQALFPGYIQEF